ncbi:MAG: hypothetical protein JNK76_02050 [Planctomycetales bacterium]|nr:hypothetical protein [Planctomycetales bacterium]MBN8626167.1 hypothetical protein [Planctomycetota bacterium]
MFAFGIVVLLTGGTYLAWRFGPPMIDGVSHLLRYLFARRTSVKEWDDASDRAFVVLPYAAGGAAAAWIIFAATGYGGWPKHFVLCCFWNAFAAWFYLTLLYRWRQAVQNCRNTSA